MRLQRDAVFRLEILPRFSPLISNFGRDWAGIVDLRTLLLTLILLSSSLMAQELPDGPRPHLTMRPVDHSEDMLVHNRPSQAPKFRDPIKDWKFWAGTGVLIGSTLYDQQKTLDGLRDTSCVEKNGGDPHPTRGKLMTENLPVIAGLTAFKYFLAKSHSVPWWSSESIDAVGSFVHIRGGMAWNGCKR